MKKIYSYILSISLITATFCVGFSHDAIAKPYSSGQGDVNKISSTLSPNPAKDKTTLKFQQYGRETFRLEVYDIIGNQVKTVSEIQSGSVEIDLSDLEAGMYFYFLVRGNDRVSTGRLIVKQ